MRDEDGEEVRVCVDGKQRLTSIVKFLDGHVCSPHPLLSLSLGLTHIATADRVCVVVSHVSQVRLVKVYVRQGPRHAEVVVVSSPICSSK
jgi:hypothetical protein